ncbi:selenite/tellurite reduction operon protein ExtJ [Thermodesulfovibrio hydrogeniphilus]
MRKAVALLVAFVFVFGVAFASFAAEAKEVKGTVTKIEGNKVTVKQADGKEVTVEVKDAKGIKVGDKVTIKDGVVKKEETKKEEKPKKKKAVEGC